MTDKEITAKKDLLYGKVETTPQRVKVRMADGTMVEGVLHQPTTLRLTDMLNRNTKDNLFLAVTDAHVIFQNGEHLQYRFLAINREMIVCCFPDKEEVDQFL